MPRDRAGTGHEHDEPAGVGLAPRAAARVERRDRELEEGVVEAPVALPCRHDEPARHEQRGGAGDGDDEAGAQPHDGSSGIACASRR